MKHPETKPSSAKVTTFKDGIPTHTEMKEVHMPKQEATPNGGDKKAEATPKAPKTPAESKVTRDVQYKFLKDADDTVKHHQQKVILEQMKAGHTTLKDLVTTIGGNQELVKRMNTNQPIERCVRYHAAWLENHGFINIAKPPKAEKKEPEKKAAPAKTEAPSKLTHAGA